MADEAKYTDGGTPWQDKSTAASPEARDDIPPMERVGMPLYNPEHYQDAPEPSDETETESDESGKKSRGTPRAGNAPLATNQGRV